MQVRQSTIRIEPGYQLLDTALAEQDDLVLALLLQNSRRKGGSIRLFPLSAAAEHQLTPPNNRQQQVETLWHISINIRCIQRIAQERKLE